MHRPASHLTASRVGDEIDIVGMAPEEECEHERFVLTPWERHDTLAVPLSQLEGVGVDEETLQMERSTKKPRAAMPRSCPSGLQNRQKVRPSPAVVSNPATTSTCSWTMPCGTSVSAPPR